MPMMRDTPPSAGQAADPREPQNRKSVASRPPRPREEVSGLPRSGPAARTLRPRRNTQPRRHSRPRRRPRITSVPGQPATGRSAPLTRSAAHPALPRLLPAHTTDFLGPFWFPGSRGPTPGPGFLSPGRGNGRARALLTPSRPRAGHPPAVLTGPALPDHRTRTRSGSARLNRVQQRFALGPTPQDCRSKEWCRPAGRQRARWLFLAPHLAARLTGLESSGNCL
jgi:hypothetical protein